MLSKLRILHIDSEASWRGGQNQVRLLSEGLAANQINCHVAALAKGELAKRLPRSVGFFPLPRTGGWSPATAWRLANYCKSNKIDILHAHASHAHDLALLVKWLLPRTKLVVHRRVDYAPAANFFSRRKYLTAAVDKFVCVSHAIAQILQKYGITAEKIAVVHSAVEAATINRRDSEEYRTKLLASLNRDASLPLLVNVAALTEQKDHATLLRALAHLRDAGTSFTCVIAGEGHLRPQLEAIRRELRLTRSVYFLGYRDDVKHLIAASDIFVLSSQDEGLGTVLLDAALARKCTVATAVGGIPEIVQDGRTGLLAARGADHALAKLLQLSCEDSSLRERLGDAAFAHVSENFSLKQMLDGNLAVYQQLMMLKS